MSRVPVGTKLYGKCDAVPGLGHVATKFFHVGYVPIVPLRSFLVLGEDEDSFRGIEVSFSIKSILLGYLRGALGWLAFMLSTLAVMGYFAKTLVIAGRPFPFWELALLAAVPWVLFIGSYFVGGASEARRAELQALAR